MKMESQPYYWNDPHKSEFQIKIVSSFEADGHQYIEIQEPVVKPTGGGQAGDRGVIVFEGKEYPFIDTIIHDEKIVLVVKNVVPGRGNGQLKIDMEWRREMMTNHTSEHIFVGALKKRYHDAKLGRIWIDGIHGTIVLEDVNLTMEEILEVEPEVTNIIDEKIPVTTEIVKADEVDESVRAREGVTSKHKKIRLVKVGKFDTSACSGVHVTNTSEIGAFKIIDIKILDNEIYIEFVSGKKAIEILNHVYNEVLLRKYDYPFEIVQLGAIIDKSKVIQNSYDHLLEKVLQLFRQGIQKEKIGEVEFWFEYLPGLDSATIKHLLKELHLKAPSITLFFAPGRKTNFTLWTKGMPKNAAFYVSELVDNLGGRGGGSDEVYTGGFTEVDDPEKLFNSIVNGVRNRLLN